MYHSTRSTAARFDSRGSSAWTGKNSCEKSGIVCADMCKHVRNLRREVYFADQTVFHISTFHPSRRKGGGGRERRKRGLRSCVILPNEKSSPTIDARFSVCCTFNSIFYLSRSEKPSSRRTTARLWATFLIPFKRFSSLIRQRYV